MDFLSRFFSRDDDTSEEADTFNERVQRLAEGTASDAERPAIFARGSRRSTRPDTANDAWSPDDTILSSACRRRPVTAVVDRIDCSRPQASWEIDRVLASFGPTTPIP